MEQETNPLLIHSSFIEVQRNHFEKLVVGKSKAD